MVLPFDPKQCPAQAFDTGQAIFLEGDRAAFVYLVQSGRVDIYRGKGAHRRKINSIGPGGVFGEMAVIDGEPRMADAIAGARTVCLLIPRAVLEEKLKSADPFIRALLRILVRNMRSMAAEMD